MTAPPLFVLFGVSLGLLGTPVRDVTAWNACWIAVLLYGLMADDRPAPKSAAPMPGVRVFHGVTAAILSLFGLFHLGNHLTGLLDADAHARVMAIGRMVYRSRTVEPLLIGLMGLQLVSGGRLAWNWTAITGDVHRTIQIGSGVYVGAFIVTHLNSALVSARLVRGLPTDWAWASGVPEGLLADAWNVRLVPHYGLGVFFVLDHLCAGLRVVLLAHGGTPRTVDRLRTTGVAVSGMVAVTIIAALCDLRI